MTRVAPPVEDAAIPERLRLVRTDLKRELAYIDGRWTPAGATFPVHDPASGETIAEVADGTAAMAVDAVDAAAAAFVVWRGWTAKARAQVLRCWFDLIVQHTEDLARLMSREQGKPLTEARAEITYAAGYVEWFAEEAKRAYGDIIPSPSPGRQTLAFKEPVGVVALITPWNFPAAMIARKIAPALAAGCTVVAKPAAETPLSALALAVLAEAAGAPAGVLNVVPTSNAAEVCGVWMQDPRVRKVSFTGSTAVGKVLIRQGAETVKRMSMELGGNAPAIIFDDADLDLAMAGLMAAKFRNSGQACIAANRVYVQAGVYEEVCRRAAAALGALTVGAAADGPADIGPLIHMRAARAMAELVEDAVSQGARLVVGGRPHALGGAFFEPTLLTGATPRMKVCRQEIFGPLLVLSPFETQDEVVRLANETPFGLAAYVFSRDLRKAWTVAAGLEAGVVGVNEGAISTEVAPFGGVKESGFGREGSKYGISDYQNMKYVCLGMG